MKHINYKAIKSAVNLPKYDLGAQPISSGYQKGSGSSGDVGYTQNATPITNSFVPQAITEAAGTAVNLGTGLGSTFFNAARAANQSAANIGTQFGTLAGKQLSGTSGAIMDQIYNEGLQQVKENSSTSVANNFIAAGGKLLGALGAIHGGINFIGNQLDYKNTLTTGDLQDASSQYTDYVNGVAYNQYGGFDKTGADKYISAQNDAGMIKGISSGVEAGAGLGSVIAPGIGTLVGAGVGALGGWIGGLFGRNKRKNEYHRRLEQWKNTASGYNMQSESSAASQGLQNQYYATHSISADSGLNLNTPVKFLDKGKQNAWVSAEEVPVEVNERGDVIHAGIIPGDANHMPRQDNIAAHVTDKIGIGGSKINERTGIMFKQEMAPLAIAFNSTSDRNEKKIIGEMLKQELAEQAHTRDNNPNPYDMKRFKKYNLGKCLPKYDPGLAFSLIPTAIGSAAGLMQYLNYKKSTPSARMSYTPNMQAQSVLNALAGRRYDVRPTLNEINNAARYSQYAINQNYNPGQRLAMLSSLYNNRMNSISNAYDQASKINNEYIKDWANTKIATGEANAARYQNAVTNYSKDLATAYGVRNKGMENGITTMLISLFSGLQNMSNNYWAKKRLSLFSDEDDIRRDEIKYLTKNK